MSAMRVACLLWGGCVCYEVGMSIGGCVCYKVGVSAIGGRVCYRWVCLLL